MTDAFVYGMMTGSLVTIVAFVIATYWVMFKPKGRKIDANGKVRPR